MSTRKEEASRPASDMERETPPELRIDATAIGRALGCDGEPLAEGEGFEYQLRNRLLGITLKLAVDSRQRTASLYLRGANAFLGFAHVDEVKTVVVEEQKGEVAFVAGDGRRIGLVVQRGGFFLVTASADEGAVGS